MLKYSYNAVHNGHGNSKKTVYNCYNTEHLHQNGRSSDNKRLKYFKSKKHKAYMDKGIVLQGHIHNQGHCLSEIWGMGSPEKYSIS